MVPFLFGLFASFLTNVVAVVGSYFFLTATMALGSKCAFVKPLSLYSLLISFTFHMFTNNSSAIFTILWGTKGGPLVPEEACPFGAAEDEAEEVESLYLARGMMRYKPSALCTYLNRHNMINSPVTKKYESMVNSR